MVTIPAVSRCGLISRRQRIRRKVPCGLTLGLFWFLLATAGYCEDPLQGALTMGLGDVAAIKQRAEAGDAKAQVALANALVSQFRSAEALSWYSKAAAQGNVEGQYHVGEILLFGRFGIPATQIVTANSAEGIRWTFMAATNFHPYACQDMAKALQSGIGVSTNLVEAYAWWQLFADTSSGLIIGQVSMNELALKLSTSDLQQAQRLAARFKQREWPMLSPRKIAEGDRRLKLAGITAGTKSNLAVINGKTLAEGESVTIQLKPESVTIKCLKIEKDSVLIAVESEDQPRWLRLR